MLDLRSTSWATPCTGLGKATGPGESMAGMCRVLGAGEHLLLVSVITGSPLKRAVFIIALFEPGKVRSPKNRKPPASGRPGIPLTWASCEPWPLPRHPAMGALRWQEQLRRTVFLAQKLPAVFQILFTHSSWPCLQLPHLCSR